MEKETQKELDERIRDTREKIKRSGAGFANIGIPSAYGENLLEVIFEGPVYIYESVKSLEDSINKNSEASNQLSRQVLRLNKILTAATVIIAIATALGLIAAFCK